MSAGAKTTLGWDCVCCCCCCCSNVHDGHAPWISSKREIGGRVACTRETFLGYTGLAFNLIMDSSKHPKPPNRAIQLVAIEFLPVKICWFIGIPRPVLCLFLRSVAYLLCFSTLREKNFILKRRSGWINQVSGEVWTNRKLCHTEKNSVVGSHMNLAGTTHYITQQLPSHKDN